MPQQTFTLLDGRRVRYAIKKRSGEPNYFVVFRSMDGCRMERSTKENSQKRAHEAACQIIQEELSPKVQTSNVTWDETVEKMLVLMKAQNLRPATIQDYRYMVQTVRRVLPWTKGPADVTVEFAKEFKVQRLQKVQVDTVHWNIHKLTVLWNKWFMNECGILSENPWEEVEKPKLDEPQPRYIEDHEAQAFYEWLLARWDGWRLPVLFFRVKGMIGRRIHQLCSLPSGCLRDGRLVFESETCKGRKMEWARVPEAIYEELQGIVGPAWLWESHVSGLRAFNIAHHNLQSARNVKEFSPERFMWWLQFEVTEYNRTLKNTPGFRKFTAHNFRDTAMTRAWDANISVDKAAIALGCHPETMKKHYVVKDRMAIADEVLSQIQK